MKKTLCVICVAALLLTSFAGCGYRISIEKIDKDEDETSTAAPETTTCASDIPLPSGYDILDSDETTTEETTTAEETTVSELDAMGVIVETDFRPVAMDTAAVLDFYTEAVNNVKLRCPGFIKKEYQEIGDVTAGSGSIDLANKILNLVGTELLTASGDSDSTVRVAAHDDVRVREQFPVFGEEFGCRVQDLSIIKSAACFTNGKQYKIVITFNDQLNPEPKDCDFGYIMTPIERRRVAGGIEEYVVVLDSEQFKFDFNYTDCELICYVDMQTGRLSSLTQKMIIDLDIDLDLDLFVVKTKVVQAKGRLINHLEYTDFDWSE